VVLADHLVGGDPGEVVVGPVGAAREDSATQGLVAEDRQRRADRPDEAGLHALGRHDLVGARQAELAHDAPQLALVKVASPRSATSSGPLS